MSNDECRMSNERRHGAGNTAAPLPAPSPLLPASPIRHSEFVIRHLFLVDCSPLLRAGIPRGDTLDSTVSGDGHRGGGRRAAFQSRHPADSVGPLLRLPRAGFGRAEGRLAARYARGCVRLGDRARRRRQQRSDRSRYERRPGRADAAAAIRRSRRSRRQQIELLRKWINAGAKYEPHWAYIPPQRPAVPASEASRLAAQRRSIGSCSRSMEASGIAPSPEADRRHARPPRCISI